MAGNADQRALLAAMARSGSAGREAYRQQQDQYRATTRQAFEQALGGYTGQGPASFQIAGQARRSSAQAAAPWLAQHEQTRAADRGVGSLSAGKGYTQGTGKYAGWSTIGSMEDAARGRGALMQAQDQELANQAAMELLGMYDEAQLAADTDIAGTRDMAERYYGLDKAREGTRSLRAYEQQGEAEARIANLTNRSLYTPRPSRGRVGSPGASTSANRVYGPGEVPRVTAAEGLGADRQPDANVPTFEELLSARQERNRAKKRNEEQGYKDMDAQWAAEWGAQQEAQVPAAWDEYLLAMQESMQPGVEAVNALSSRPLSDYAREAAIVDYGIDPNLAYGMFSPSEEIKDFRNARDLEAIQQFGMPWSDYQGMLGEQSDLAAEQQDAELDEAIYQATGFGGRQLASSTGVPMQYLPGVLNSPEYAEAMDLILEAAASRDPYMAHEAWAMASGDPMLARVLEATAGNYQPKGYSLYGDPDELYGE